MLMEKRECTRRTEEEKYEVKVGTEDIALQR